MSKSNKQPTVVPTIRWMVRADMGNVIEIGREVYGMSFNQKIVLGMFKNRNSTILVSEVPSEDMPGDTEIAGFIAYTLLPDHIGVSCMVVAERHKHRGIGTSLLKKIMLKLGRRRQYVELTVPEVCLEMQQFLRYMSVPAVETLRGFFEWIDGSCVDGVLFRGDRVHAKKQQKASC